jgi:phosphatidate cytidylyltransferase
MTTSERLFDFTLAFENPATAWMCAAVVFSLATASVLVRLLYRTGQIGEPQFGELLARTRSWYILVVVMLGPILLGAAWTMAFFALLALLCFGEFARAVGLARHRAVSAAVIAGIIVVFFAAADHWYGLFVAAWPLAVALIAVVTLLADEPQGYIQRVGLAIFAFSLFGMSVGHLAYMANDVLFRPMLIWLLLSVELNDVFAYICGKLFGRRRLAPKTSPNKTIGGAVGAVVATTLVAAIVGHFVFHGTEIDRPVHLVALGVLISLLGQCGDLVLSSIKRDLGIKDMAATIPGHGGLLDRFDSLLLVAPGVFHYVGYVKSNGLGLDQPTRIMTGA